LPFLNVSHPWIDVGVLGSNVPSARRMGRTATLSYRNKASGNFASHMRSPSLQMHPMLKLLGTCRGTTTTTTTTTTMLLTLLASITNTIPSLSLSVIRCGRALQYATDEQSETMGGHCITQPEASVQSDILCSAPCKRSEIGGACWRRKRSRSS
jgi:hypothetical protein